jgi:hypothetical protein
MPLASGCIFTPLPAHQSVMSASSDPQRPVLHRRYEIDMVDMCFCRPGYLDQNLIWAGKDNIDLLKWGFGILPFAHTDPCQLFLWDADLCHLDGTSEETF